MRRPAHSGSPVVVKIGSSSLATAGGGIEAEGIGQVVGNVEAAWEMGYPTVLVTSGAVAAGLPSMGLETRPTDLPGLQVAAALGQTRLMAMYDAAFSEEGRRVGQVLLTRDVLARRDQYLHARLALQRMLGLGVVPIVNENDTVVVDELRFGDNDRLAAIVSHLVGAGMLILLTDTPGIYSDDPWMSGDAELLSAVRHTDQILDDLRASATRGSFGSGGVASKVAAARMAAFSGVPTVIASSKEVDVVASAIQGKEVGTWVDPRESSLSARKLWIAFGTPSEGSISVDDGAAAAITDGGKSLLPVGVTRVEGTFDVGSAVEILCSGHLVAKGLVAMSAAEVAKVRGEHSSVAGGEVIHRDDLVVLA